MALIRIERNEDGNCINFHGTTNPSYWNACLSAEVDAQDTDTVNVINDVRSEGAETQYEFFRIPYTDLRDADNNPFASASDAAAYITAQGNVLNATGSTYKGTWNSDTNTPTLTSSTHAGNDGDFYYVSIAGSTTIDGVSSWRRGDKIIWNGTTWQKLAATTVVDANTRSTLLNTQTAIFADGEAATADANGAPGWYYRNSENRKINWYFYGDTDVTSYNYGDFGGFYAVIDIKTQGAHAYWTVYTKVEGDGLDQASWYRSRINFSDASAMQALAPGKYLVHSTGFDVTGIEPTLPRLSVGTDASTTIGEQGAGEELYLMALSTSSGLPEGTNEFIVEKVAFKLGDYIQAYDLVSPPEASPSSGSTTPTDIDFRLEQTDTTILVDDGKQYGVNSIHAVDNGDGTITIRANPEGQIVYENLIFANVTIAGSPAGSTASSATNALNSLFQVQPMGAGGDYAPTYPTLTGTAVTGTLAEGQTPSTTKSDEVTLHYYTTGADTSGHGARFWSTETIDTAGEYYTVKITGNGRFVIGFADGTTDSNDSGTADDLEELANNAGATASGLLWSQAFYDYGSYTAPWTWYGSSTSSSYGPGWTGSTTTTMRYNTVVQDAITTADNSDGVLLKAGIDQNGYLAVWYYDDSRSNDWILCSRRNITTDGSKDYHLVVKLWNGNATLVEIPERTATDPSAPALNYRFIESPDGSYHYPLFATAEEANYVDTANGGSGSSHAHVYLDEPTFTTWYMPDTGGFMDVSSAPLDTAEITYSEIATLADGQFAPGQLTLSDQTVAENTAVNLPIQPVDQVPIAVVTGLPSPLVFQSGSIVGTTPYVAADTDYVITVARSNGYGTTTQTFTLTITDNSSLGDFTGYTEYGGNLVQPNRIILTDDAVVQYDTLLSQGQELTYSFTGQVPPTIGILSGTGSTALGNLGSNTLGSVGYDFAETSMWDLRYVTAGGNLGGPGQYALTGWSDNSTSSGAYPGDQDGGEWKLEYSTDGYIRLYYNGVLKKTSASTFTGDKAITLAAFDTQAQSDVYIPSNWTISTTGAGSTTPPAGFVDPLLAGTMASTTVLHDSAGTGAAAQLTDTLDVNRRYIVPQTWIEANVLPNITGSGANATDDEQFLFGVAKSSASWSNVDVTSFHSNFRVEGTNGSNLSTLFVNGSASGAAVNINSTTDAYYDYAIEWDGTDLHVIACNINDINNQPAVSRGGAFSRVATYSNFAAQGDASSPLELAAAVRNDGEVTLSTSGLQNIRIPFGARDILVGESSIGNAGFSALQPAASKYDSAPNGHAPSDFSFGAPTLNAGYTYRFVYHPSMESADYIEFRRADDNTVYTTGVTTFGSGDPDFTGAYKGVEFAVPADAPPLKVFFYNSFSTSFDAGRDLPISGSTYVVPVTGITLEGPAANQTGTNVMDQYDHGWISLDEQLSAGERLVMDNAFWTDFLAELNESTNMFAIGLKGDNWTNTKEVNAVEAASTGEFFKGDTYIVGSVSGGNYIYFRIWSNGVASNQMLVNTTALHSTVCAFLEITNSGDNIRAGFGRNGNLSVTQGDEATVAYADWSSYKGQTGDQGYGITSKDVVISFWTYSGGAIDGADIDWTGLSEVSVPTPAATMTTPWTKALDFSGGSEHTLQVNNNYLYTPLNLGSVSTTVAAPAATGNTSNDSNARPWATAIVFNPDGNATNQHIWNLGEGAGSLDDNIYVRADASGNLYFGWGRDGALNECSLGAFPAGSWHGLYVAHTGERLSKLNASAANLADCFDIRVVNLSSGAAGSNLSTSTNWTNTGGRMDRQFTGSMTIGGRGSNRNFHGKVAAMVVTTLRRNVAMPTDAEISMMVRDPQQWLTDYKVGNSYRRPSASTDNSNFQLGSFDPASSTQVWLMGDGTSDAYAKIRNQVYAADQNRYPMNMISMVSSDIETVNIPGLS
jgi:hypothetical protein